MTGRAFFAPGCGRGSGYKDERKVFIAVFRLLQPKKQWEGGIRSVISCPANGPLMA